MTAVTIRSTSASPAPPGSLVLIAVGLAWCAAVGFAALSARESEYLRTPGVRFVLAAWVISTYVVAGVIAWRRRPDSNLGPLMIAAGGGTFIATLGWANHDLLRTTGQALELLPPILFLHVYLAFPSGRLHGRVERGVVLGAYVTGIGFGVARMLSGGLEPGSVMALTSAPDLADVLLRLQLVSSAALSLAGIAVLGARRRRRGRALRRSLSLLIDSFSLALLMIAALAVQQLIGSSRFEVLGPLTFVVVGLAPLAFLIGLLHARLARSAVGDLFAELRSNPSPNDLQAALSRALRDPSLELAFWLPEFDSYADLNGRPVEVPAPGRSRRTTLINDKDGARVAALVHDPALEDEPELLAAVSAAAGFALDNARLQAELRARVAEVRGSRARVIAAGDEERRRLERNLHDGAQQRLVALSLDLSLLQAQVIDCAASRGLGQARQEIATSLDELREIARGIHPAVLSGHGLVVALDQLAARAPVPVRLSVDLHARLPEPVEVAAFYVISESLANIGKHACATSASVEVSQDEDQVVIQVVDDGVGGADTELGTGLRGLADRVEALDGLLRIWSPCGGGTRVRAELPCAP